MRNDPSLRSYVTRRFLQHARSVCRDRRRGPSGCGKTRFGEYMAWKLGKPLVTVACNEDMTASDLVGRFLLDANGTRWQDGPLTMAARFGGICYLDEVVEARQHFFSSEPFAGSRRISCFC